jgi:hypothetical protein
MASHAALTHKPHVGEGVKEEQARLEMAFKVAEKLCDLFRESDPVRAKGYAEHSIATMTKAPPYLRDLWKEHYLMTKFKSILYE